MEIRRYATITTTGAGRPDEFAQFVSLLKDLRAIPGFSAWWEKGTKTTTVSTVVTENLNLIEAADRILRRIAEFDFVTVERLDKQSPPPPAAPEDDISNYTAETVPHDRLREWYEFHHGPILDSYGSPA